MEAGDLASLWQGAAPVRASAGGDAPRTLRRRAQRVSAGTATLLDRALWLLVLRCELWTTLDGESHDTLACGATPYDRFFSCVERNIHEHGPLAPAALLGELRTVADEIGAGPVIVRISAFHDPDPQIDLAQELALVLDRLRLRAVEEELELLFSSGEPSPDALQRSKELREEQKRLKAQLGKVPASTG
jgi:DNA primase